MVHLPNYLTLEEDYRGEKRLMEVISSLYNFTMPKNDIEKANEQEGQIKTLVEQMIEQEPRYKIILEKLEEVYDSRIKTGEAETRLAPEVEKFLLDMEKRFTQL
jgi:hypothetical protein